MKISQKVLGSGGYFLTHTVGLISYGSYKEGRVYAVKLYASRHRTVQRRDWQATTIYNHTY